MASIDEAEEWASRSSGTLEPPPRFECGDVWQGRIWDLVPLLPDEWKSEINRDFNEMRRVARLFSDAKEALLRRPPAPMDDLIREALDRYRQLTSEHGRAFKLRILRIAWAINWLRELIHQNWLARTSETVLAVDRASVVPQTIKGLTPELVREKKETYVTPSNFDRNLWMLERKQKGCTNPQIRAELARDTHSDWALLESDQAVSDAIKSVADHLGIQRPLSKRGRPGKPRKPQ
jgi:hypothetical protein